MYVCETHRIYIIYIAVIITKLNFKLYILVIITLSIAEPEIVVSHWPFSNQFQDLAKQK